MLSVIIAAAAMTAPATIYDFTMNSIDNKPVPLKEFKGKVLMVVNVASFCGNTPQYAALEALYEKYKSKGFVVMGFPANEFGQQEPGTNAEIKEFCTSKYKVSFPMFSKIIVKGEGIHPLYQWLIANSGKADDIGWNFEKFIISRDGTVLSRVSPRTQPDSPEVVTLIEKALAATPAKNHPKPPPARK